MRASVGKGWSRLVRFRLAAIYKGQKRKQDGGRLIGASLATRRSFDAAFTWEKTLKISEKIQNIYFLPDGKTYLLIVILHRFRPAVAKQSLVY